MVTGCLIGIILEISAGLAGTGGKQLIGLSAHDANHCRARVTLFLGMFMTFLLGAVLNAAAYAFAPQSVIAPLQGVEISLNIVLAPFILGEEVTTTHVLATFLIASGASLTACFGPQGEDPISLEPLKGKLFSWIALCYAFILSIVFLLCAAVVHTRPTGIADRARGIALGISTGAVAGNMLFMKCALGFAGQIADGNWSSWSDWLPYVLVFLAIATGVGNVPLMVKGLMEYPASFMVTLVGGSSIVTASVSGAMVLQEMTEISLKQQVHYWASVIIIIIGLIMINMTTVHHDEECKVVGRKEEPMIDDEAPGPMPKQMFHRSGAASKHVIPMRRAMSVQWAHPLAGFVSVTTLGKPKIRRRRSVQERAQELRRTKTSNLAPARQEEPEMCPSRSEPQRFESTRF